MDLAVAKAGPGAAGRHRLVLLGLLPAMHLLMLAYDWQHPDRFLHADRASDRMEVLESFRQIWNGGGELSGFLVQHGIVGDWLPQALLYLWGGQFAVIAAQVLLALFSILWVRDIGLRLGLRADAACTAALVYGLLPHTLVLPHQLTSEAIFIPMVVGSFALFARALVRGRSFAASGALLGAATLVRPITLLWPFICAPFNGAKLRAVAAFLVAALAPLLAWMFFIFAMTGEFSMGRSAHDLGRNLYARAEHIAEAADLPASQHAAAAHGDRRLSIAEYGEFALEHPAPTFLHSARDLLVLGAKSGLERIVLDYLDLAPAERADLQRSEEGWREQLERQGAWTTFTTTLKRNPALTLSSAGGAVLFLGFMLLALAGAIGWLRAAADVEPRVHKLRILLLLFPLYILATAQVIDRAQSRHRAPAEFAICLLAVAGFCSLRRSTIQVRYAH